MEKKFNNFILTQERANQFYESVMDNLDPFVWQVLTQSDNEEMNLAEFIKRAEKRILHTGFSNYSPSEVAKDSINILKNMKQVFDVLKSKLMISFEGILVSNESLNETITVFNEEMDQIKKDNEELVEDNENLFKEVDFYKEQLKIKNDGLAPLKNIVDVGIDNIIKVYEDLKSRLGKEDTKKILPIMKKEINDWIKVIELRREQLLSSNIEFKGVSRVLLGDSNVDDKKVVDEGFDDNAVFGSDDILNDDDEVDHSDVEVPENFPGVTKEQYIDALENNVKKKFESDEIFEARLKVYINQHKDE